MKEYYFILPDTHPFYQQCIDYDNITKALFKQAHEYIEKSTGEILDIKTLALMATSIYIKLTPDNKKKFSKYCSQRDFGERGTYLKFKKNNKIGKYWKYGKPLKPSLIIDYNIVDITKTHGERIIIYDKKVYCRISGENFILPETATKLTEKEYFDIIYKIRNSDLEYILI